MPRSAQGVMVLVRNSRPSADAFVSRWLAGQEPSRSDTDMNDFPAADQTDLEYAAKLCKPAHSGSHVARAKEEAPDLAWRE